jgi:hypothetical protein
MASSLSLVDGTNLELMSAELLSFSVPKANPRGGKAVNILNKYTKQSLNVVTPVMTTWGAQEGKNSEGEPTGKWSVSLQFPSDEYPNPEASKFLDFIKKFEEQVKNAALKNAMEWLGIKNAIPQVIDVMFNPMLKYPKLVKNKPDLDYNKPPTLTGKLPLWESGWQLEVFDEDSKPLFVKADNGIVGASPLTHLSGIGKAKILNARFILQPTVWIANQKASVTWNVKQALVKKPKTETIPAGICMLQLSVDDKLKLDEEIKHIEPTDLNTYESKEDNTISAVVDDSDDDEDDKDDKDDELLIKSTPIPTPITEEPKKGKKSVKKT